MPDEIVEHTLGIEWLRRPEYTRWRDGTGRGCDGAERARPAARRDRDRAARGRPARGGGPVRARRRCSPRASCSRTSRDGSSGAATLLAADVEGIDALLGRESELPSGNAELLAARDAAPGGPRRGAGARPRHAGAPRASSSTGSTGSSPRSARGCTDRAWRRSPTRSSSRKATSRRRSSRTAGRTVCPSCRRHPSGSRRSSRSSAPTTRAVLIGFMPARERGVTLEKAAVNAVMAGCLPGVLPGRGGGARGDVRRGLQRAHGPLEHGRRGARARRQRPDRGRDRDERALQLLRPRQPGERDDRPRAAARRR